MINRTKAPKIKPPVDFDIYLPDCERYTLDNGIDLYYVNMGTEDTLMINWVFYAGNWYETKRNVAIAANHLIKNGTLQHNAYAINNHFDYYGAYFNRSCYAETAEVALHCLGKHAKDLLPIVADLIANAQYPEEELQIYQQNAKQRLSVSLLKPDFVAGRMIDAALFGPEHPYGKYSEMDDYSNLNRTDLLAFHDTYYKNGKAVLFAAGKLPDGFLSMMNEHFGKFNWKHHHTVIDKPQHILQPSAEKKLFYSVDPNGVQASLRMARHFPGKSHPDYHAAMVLNTVYGGFFGSRLMNNIREEKGYTYGIYSYLLNYVEHSGWVISTEAGVDVKNATTEEVYNEMQLLREELIDEEELDITRNYLMGVILGDLDGPFQIIGQWKSLILQNFEKDYFYKGIETIRTVQPEHLQEIANKYLVPEEFYELTVI